MANNEPKQVLVWRADLRNSNGQKVRTGKIAAQLAHASLGAILNYNLCDYTKLPTPVRQWLEGRFTKICVSVDSEHELLEIYNKAIQTGINVKLIKDAGLTEFNGVPTLTCLCLGPDYPSVIDPITSHLRLL
ncbi:MAG: aminoacyl-tRNA hydrolase [Hydrotalea sp. AMD]|uniref:aminoacyl-tRNA hydrolase n=1 Tax=Hydrotalea sp. AMD TaxID=2501297 RepID=UPI0010270567|nr:aminoacyl-tRNA hydrolase [Hydrotalea sp. AMD]RWZ87231.1 MAG: aminoacyl-tRNA hydrolase [Hydrotalea sp. AMD]